MEPLLVEDADIRLVKELSESRAEPKWLLKQRVEALELFEKLPQEKSPLYGKYSDIKSSDFQGIDMKNRRIPSSFTESSEELESFLGDEQLKSLLIQVDDKVVKKTIDNEDGAKGVILTDIANALEEHPNLIKKYFLNGALKSQDDKFVALNHAFFNSGLFIYVPKNTSLKQPITNLFLSKTVGAGIFSRNLIVLDEGSSLKFIDESHSMEGDCSDIHSLYSTVTDIHLAKRSQFTYGGIQNLGNNVINLANKKVILDGDSRITSSQAYFGGGLTRTRLDNVLVGPNASTEDMEVILADNVQRFDMVSDLTHESTSTRGTVMLRGVLMNKSKGIFKGMIRIGKDAEGAEAYLEEHAMLLTKGAMANAIPGLEIETNDVKATHSASVALVEEEEIFYLMSRGLDKDEARKMVVLAFIEPIIRRIPSPNVRHRIWYLFELKWRKDKGLKLRPEDMVLLDGDFEETERSGPQEFFDRHYKYA